MRKLFFDNVTIIGVGLIGASCALALKDRGLCGTICGLGRNETNLIEAKKEGIIDEYSLEIGRACGSADLVILATPVGSLKKLMSDMRNILKKTALVTDVGSVKGPLVHELETLMPEGAHYVGSHPIAGSDNSGIGYARPDLFDQARCIVTPTARSDKKAQQQIVSMWELFGGRVELMDPMLHDRIYAAVSHLPHLIAYALVNTVDSAGAEYLEYAGPGFKDTTRIALSSPELWRDIALSNRDNLVALMERFENHLKALAMLIRDTDAAGLEHEISRAQALRKKIT